MIKETRCSFVAFAILFPSGICLAEESPFRWYQTQPSPNAQALQPTPHTTNALPSFVSDDGAASPVDVGWYFLSWISAMENKQAGLGRRVLEEGVGLGSDSATRVLLYAQAVVAEYRNVSATSFGCAEIRQARRQGTLAEAMLANRIGSDQRRKDLADGLEQVLSSGESVLLRRWLQSNFADRVKKQNIDYARLFSENPSAAEKIEERACAGRAEK